MSWRGYRMRVATVDRHGRRKGPVEWVDVPPAERFASNGMSHIESCVARVLRSKGPSSWIVVSTPSGLSSMSIGKHNGVTTLATSIDVRRKPARESAVRAFFADRKIAPIADYLAANGGVPKSTRVLEYPVGSSAKRIASVAREFLRNIYKLTDRSALNIRYGEREQPNNAMDSDTTASPLRARYGARHRRR
jgi:hypothetical protein